MYSRDKLLFGVGTVTALLGFLATIAWNNAFGILALLVIAVIILVFQVLQRHQLAKIQDRTLKLLQNGGRRETDTMPRDGIPVEIATKKIVGILQAQQTSIDLLSERLVQREESQTSDRD